MSMGKRRQRQESLFIMADGLPKTAGHPFYQKLNALLAEADFDRWIEKRCQRYYEREEKRGQPRSRRASIFACCWWATSKASTASAASPGAAQTASACGNSSAFRWTKQRLTPRL